MLFVLGAGSFAPGQLLPEQLLRELGGNIPSGAPSGLKRQTTLNLEVLRSLKNSDLQQALQTASPTCTDMGERAARQAIERAGITVDQIGMVLGDCATPIEVTPSEGQRVAGRLGLKVPAYDIYTCSGICPAHLSILSTWKKERLPRYILCVSTNAPTQRVDYSKGEDGWYYSDGASACVVSAEDCRGLELVWNDFRVDSARKSAFELDTLGFLTRGTLQPDAVKAQAQALLSALANDGVAASLLKQSLLFWSLGDVVLQCEILQASGVSAEQVINLQQSDGDMLGSSSFFALAQKWDALTDGQAVAVLVAEGAINYGGALFRMHRGA